MPEADLALLMRAARAAGDVARRFFRGSYKVWDKGGAEGPVTEADHAVNDCLSDLLRSACPGYGWLSEETPDTPARLSARRVFVLDPIDGTRAFIDGNPDFAHSIAIVEDGRTIAGVVYLPMHDRLYSASIDMPSTLNGAPIRPGTRLSAEGASVLTTRAALDPAHWREGKAPGFVRAFRPSLASRLCLVADGSHDAMLTLRPAWDWDIAAGALICERAGARISDRLGHALVFNSPRARSDGVVAGGEAVWRGIVGALAGETSGLNAADPT